MRGLALVVACLLAAGCGGGASGEVDAGSSCPGGETACASNCCTADAICAQEIATGNPVCVPTCTNGSQCSGTKPSCAPLQDLQGNPTGPYVCKANDGRPYDGCSGATFCLGSGSCCVGDTAGNLFCAAPCSGASSCGGGAMCTSYDFSHTTCGGPTACGP